MALRGVAGLVPAALVAALVPSVASAKAVPAAKPAPVVAKLAVSAAPHVTVDTLTPGQGDKVPEHGYVLINYKGALKDGTVFDQAQNSVLPLDEIVPGFGQGLVGMQRGGKYRLTIPPELGYGAEASGPIPANSTLVFEIDLLDFKTAEEFAAMVAAQNAEPSAQ